MNPRCCFGAQGAYFGPTSNYSVRVDASSPAGQDTGIQLTTGRVAGVRRFREGRLRLSARGTPRRYSKPMGVWQHVRCPADLGLRGGCAQANFAGVAPRGEAHLEVGAAYEN